MKYRLIEYKVKDSNKLKIIKVVFFNKNGLNSIDVLKLQEPFKFGELKFNFEDRLNKIRKYFEFKINIIFEFNEIKLNSILIKYDQINKLFYFDKIKLLTFDKDINKNNLKEEINKIDNKLKEIKSQDLIDFILNYNKE